MILKELFEMESIMGNFWKICQGYSFGAKINSRADNHMMYFDARFFKMVFEKGFCVNKSTNQVLIGCKVFKSLIF
jgi:hypothetical protein